MYNARHFFISEIFRRTESEFWAEVFTHEGRNTNQRHYLHPEQKKADEILTDYMNSLEEAINKYEITKAYMSVFNIDINETQN